MPSSRSDWPATPNFHPEFGRLCPSSSRLGGMRLAMVSIVAALAIGATMGFAVAHWSDGTRIGLAGLPKEPVTGALDIPASSVQRSMSTDEPGASPVLRAQESCEAGVSRVLAAIFLDSSCDSVKNHARHRARASNHVATVIIGRMDPAPAASTATVAAIEPSAIGASGEKSVAASTPPLEQRAHHKKAKATSGGTSAYASAPQFGRDPYEPRGPYRYVAPQSSFDGRFGRSW
jgi:hypothetical protein